MTINFVGNFQTGYVGEVADETHLARELEVHNHTVRRIPRDEWREHVLDGKDYPNIPKDLRADINIICKWHHFEDGRFINYLRDTSGGAPVFYWVWDFMWDSGFPQWHIEMAKAADLYLSGELGIFKVYQEQGIKPYYFQMDVCDGELPVFEQEEIKYDVVFTGSYLPQGNRIAFLKEIAKEVPLTIFSWNHEEWKKEGIPATIYPAVYGAEYNRVIAQTNIVLGMSVEPYCYGYWSNRVGKVIAAGGFLLQEYGPGMETFLPNCVAYFNSAEGAIYKIKQYLDNSEKIARRKQGAQKIAKRFTSKTKMKQLSFFLTRYLRGEPKLWNRLP